MSSPPTWLLELWRAVSRQARLTEILGGVATLLRTQVPAACVAVVQLDLAHLRLELLAASDTRAEAGRLPRHLPLSERQLEALLAWARRGEVLRAGAGTENAVARVLLPAGEQELLAGPLLDRGDVGGLLLGTAPTSGTFEAAHAAVWAATLEPLAVALGNDRHMSELAALRDAAEADKLALLRRLGRDGIVDTIVGVETGLRAVMERVALVAPSDLPVLILGETGSGKEVIARAIHGRSPRRAGPFLRVNCGAVPPELIDSDLFGHEKGSFTGAVGLRKGWFERADGGTLFLDEVGELPPAVQVRLLRVLQDGTFERVGGQQSLTVDVRVIAATHPDLHAKVADRRFRQDLWYRLAIFPIELPPLRNRPEDVPGLANHFAHRAARRFGFPPCAVSPADLHLLLEYAWPGNVRELAAVLDRAAILGQGKRLEIAKALGMPLGPAASPTLTPPADVSSDGALGALDDVVREHIGRVLAATRGRIEGPHGAAAILSVNPHTLRARMRKLGINWAVYRRREPDSA
jgi:transcriptional regulator with GAF, ATPase, and Fis domain